MTEFLLTEVKADHVAFNPVIPFGRASHTRNRDWQTYLDEILERYEALAKVYGRDKIVVNLPAAFTTSALHQRCMLGDDIISVLADGSISICGFGMDEGSAVRFGDARVDRISVLWESNAGIRQLRTPGLKRLKGICSNCVFSNTCRGYCRAQALAEYGDVDAPYPVCQHFADMGAFPERYMIDPSADVSYTIAAQAQQATKDLLPTGNTHVRAIPITPISRRAGNAEAEPMAQ
jgi:radical SAM protein with 4Fe4S-binding SPASM domain